MEAFFRMLAKDLDDGGEVLSEDVCKGLRSLRLITIRLALPRVGVIN